MFFQRIRKFGYKLHVVAFERAEQFARIFALYSYRRLIVLFLQTGYFVPRPDEFIVIGFVREFYFHILHGAMTNFVHVGDVDYVSVVYKSNAVACRFQFLEKVTAHENRLAFLMFLFDDVEEGHPHQGVETGCRFVEDDYRRIVHKRGDECGFLFHTFTHTL